MAEKLTSAETAKNVADIFPVRNDRKASFSMTNFFNEGSVYEN